MTLRETFTNKEFIKFIKQSVTAKKYASSAMSLILLQKLREISTPRNLRASKHH